MSVTREPEQEWMKNGCLVIVFGLIAAFVIILAIGVG